MRLQNHSRLGGGGRRRAGTLFEQLRAGLDGTLHIRVLKIELCLTDSLWKM